MSADILHHIDEDVGIIKKLKLSHYSMTISWARMFRNGFNETDVADPDVVLIYRTYLEKLVAAGVTPIVGLYAWDLPREVNRKLGGWSEEDGVAAFVRFADACFEEFGDIVPYWITLQGRVQNRWSALFVLTNHKN